MAGPVPKRSEDRLRRNKVDITKGVAFPVGEWKVKAGWHRIAKDMFESLHTSGQSQYFQDSDWALATLLCDELSSYKKDEDRRMKQLRALDKWETAYAAGGEPRLEELGLPRRRPTVSRGGSAMKLDSILQRFGDLLVTEADRRRLRIELEEQTDKQDSAEVVFLNDYVSMLKNVD